MKSFLELISLINWVLYLFQYSSVNDAIGPFSYTNPNGTIAPLELCISSFKKGTAFGFNESYIFDSAVVRSELHYCFFPSFVSCLNQKTWNHEIFPSAVFLSYRSNPGCCLQ